MEDFQKRYVLKHVVKALNEYLFINELKLKTSGIGGDSFFDLLVEYKDSIEKEAYKGVKSKR